MSCLTFPREHRLTERPDYVRCYDAGRRFFSRRFVLFVYKRADDALPWRLGMAVTKKTGSAVWRNRLRRLIRECFRLAQHNISPGYDYVVVPKKNVDPRTLSFDDVCGEITRLVQGALPEM